MQQLPEQSRPAPIPAPQSNVVHHLTAAKKKAIQGYMIQLLVDPEFKRKHGGNFGCYCLFIPIFPSEYVEEVAMVYQEVLSTLQIE